MCSTVYKRSAAAGRYPGASQSLSADIFSHRQPVLMTANPVTRCILPLVGLGHAAFLHQPHIPGTKNDMVYMETVLSALWNW